MRQLQVPRPLKYFAQTYTLDTTSVSSRNVTTNWRC